MFMLHKNRAHRPLAMGTNINVGYAPHGIGGIGGSAPVVSLDMGIYKLYIQEWHLGTLLHELKKVKVDVAKITMKEPTS